MKGKLIAMSSILGLLLIGGSASALIKSEVFQPESTLKHTENISFKDIDNTDPFLGFKELSDSEKEIRISNIVDYAGGSLLAYDEKDNVYFSSSFYATDYMMNATSLKVGDKLYTVGSAHVFEVINGNDKYIYRSVTKNNDEAPKDNEIKVSLDFNDFNEGYVTFIDYINSYQNEDLNIMRSIVHYGPSSFELVGDEYKVFNSRGSFYTDGISYARVNENKIYFGKHVNLDKLNAGAAGVSFAYVGGKSGLTANRFNNNSLNKLLREKLETILLNPIASEEYKSSSLDIDNIAGGYALILNLDFNTLSFNERLYLMDLKSNIIIDPTKSTNTGTIEGDGVSLNVTINNDLSCSIDGEIQFSDSLIANVSLKLKLNNSKVEILENNTTLDINNLTTTISDFNYKLDSMQVKPEIKKLYLPYFEIEVKSNENA